MKMTESEFNKLSYDIRLGTMNVHKVAYLIECYIFDRLGKSIKVNLNSVISQMDSTNVMVEYAVDWYSQKFNVQFLIK